MNISPNILNRRQCRRAPTTSLSSLHPRPSSPCSPRRGSGVGGGYLQSQPRSHTRHHEFSSSRGTPRANVSPFPAGGASHGHGHPFQLSPLTPNSQGQTQALIGTQHRSRFAHPNGSVAAFSHGCCKKARLLPPEVYTKYGIPHTQTCIEIDQARFTTLLGSAQYPKSVSGEPAGR